MLASCLIVAALSIPALAREVQNRITLDKTLVILRTVNAVTVFSLGLSSVLLPRRPQVLFKDRKVDDERTVSALSRYTWSWTEPLIGLASRKNDLDSTDIPHPDQRIRAEDLKRKWDAFNFQTSLLRSLLWAFKRSLAIQWSITVFRNLVGVLPFYIMLRLINILEERGHGGSPTLELWALVAGIAAFSMLDAVRCPARK